MNEPFKAIFDFNEEPRVNNAGHFSFYDVPDFVFRDKLTLAFFFLNFLGEDQLAFLGIADNMVTCNFLPMNF